MNVDTYQLQNETPQLTEDDPLSANKSSTRSEESREHFLPKNWPRSG